MKINTYDNLISMCAILAILLGVFFFLQIVELSCTDFDESRERLEGNPQNGLARVIAVETPIVDTLSSSKPIWKNPDRGEELDSDQIVVMKMIAGAYKGRIVTADNVLHFKPSAYAAVRIGSLVRISYVPLNDRFHDVMLLKPVVRFHFIAYSVALFLILLVVILRYKGVKICISLILSVLMTYYILIPLIMAGYSPMGVIFLFSLLLAVAIFIVVGQFDFKGLSAGIGGAGGLLVAFLIAVVFSHFLNLSGIFSTKSRILSEVLEKANVHFNLTTFIVISCAVCVLGIVIDVGISIASGVHQVYLQKPGSSRSTLFAAGLNISGDVCGTTVITLFFAYLGLKICGFYLMKAAFLSPREFLNNESVSIELVQLLCGAIGVLLCGPVTALSAALILPLAEKRRTDAGLKQTSKSTGEKGKKIFLVLEIIMVLGLVFFIARALMKERAYYQRIGTPQDTEKLVKDADNVGELEELAAYWTENFYFDDAIFALLIAKEKNSQDAPVHRDLAYLYTQKKYFIPAYARVNEAMSLGAKDLKTFYTAGVVNMWLNKDEEARTYLEKALEMDPDNQDIKMALEILKGPTSEKEK